MNPAIALALLAIVGLLVTRLPPLSVPRSPTLALLLASGTPIVLLGLVLGPGIGVLDRPTLAALTPLTALVVGWVGARLGARCEWRLLRRVRRETWGVVAAQAIAGIGVVFVAAWLGARLVPGLAAAWTPRLPAALTLGGVAIIPGAKPTERAARAAGVPPQLARRLRRVALVDAACGTIACAFALALGHPRGGRVLPGWLAWLAVAVGSGVLVGLVFVGLSRLAGRDEDLDLACFATLLLGAGIGYATGLSPFLVCAVASALIVNVSPHGRRVRAALAAWEGPTYAILLVLVGAALTPPTVWVLAAVPLLGVLRLAVQWSTLRSGLAYLPAAGVPLNAGLASAAQGGAALALGLSFSLVYAAPGAAGAGAVLTTIALGVVLTHAVAPALMRLAFAPPRLTPGPLATELSPGPSPD